MYFLRLLSVFRGPPGRWGATRFMNKASNKPEPGLFVKMWKMIPGKPIIVGFIMAYAALITEDWRRTHFAYRKFRAGSRPLQPFLSFPVFRPEAKRISDFFLSVNANRGTITEFGVIFGPSGCGKSYMVKALCNEHPKGVLYLEMQPGENFAERLKREIGLNRSIMQYFLDWYNPNRNLNSTLALSELSSVCEVLVKGAIKYKQRCSKLPVIFIDGADILAKEQKQFQNLVHFARVNANEHTLITVFVSSDGSVLPIVQGMGSCVNRCTLVEVGDISEETAKEYLKRHGLSEDVSAKLVDYMGGRLAYLNRNLKLFTKNDTRDGMMQKVKESMAPEVSQMHCIFREYYNDILLIYEMMGDHGIIPRNEGIIQNVDDLVNHNILRRDGKSNLFWHSKVVLNEVKLKLEELKQGQSKLEELKQRQSKLEEIKQRQSKFKKWWWF